MKNEVEKMQIFSDNPLFGFFKNPWTIRIYSDRKVSIFTNMHRSIHGFDMNHKLHQVKTKLNKIQTRAQNVNFSFISF